MSKHSASISALQDRAGYRFNDTALLEQALTHASSTSAGRGRRDNERLEFLGDRVLALVVAEALFRLHGDVREGELARMLNALVRRQTCTEVARALDLGSALRLAASGSKDRAPTAKILGDAMEAMLAAVYLDGGLEAARAFILQHWSDKLEAAATVRKDAKTALQEWAAGKALEPPGYELLETTGPDHAPSFLVRVTVGDGMSARGQGRTRRAAEQEAAAEVLKKHRVRQ